MEEMVMKYLHYHILCPEMEDNWDVFIIMYYPDTSVFISIIYYPGMEEIANSSLNFKDTNKD